MAYLTAAAVRERVARSGSSSPLASLPDDVIDEYVAEFEEIVEDYRGNAWIPRTVTEVVEVQHRTERLWLDWPLVRSVTSVTINGTALTASSYIVTKDAGLITLRTPSATPEYPATVVYVHGMDAPNNALKRATALYVQRTAEAEKSGQGRDLIAQGIDGGTTRYSTPDKAAGRPTGWLEVDRLLNSLRPRIPGIG